MHHTVDIIVVAFNRKDYPFQQFLTKRCIQSIQDNTTTDYVLHLVDNGSDDGTYDYFQSLDVGKKLLYRLNENAGFAKGVNTALANTTDNVVLINNDAEVQTKNWIHNMLTCLNKCENAGIVAPYFDNCQGNNALVIRKGRNLPYDYRQIRSPFGFVTCLIARKLINEVGYLDENFGLGYGEDNDYETRARVLGYRFYADGWTLIHHEGSKTIHTIDAEYLKKSSQYYKEKIRKLNWDIEAIWRD